MPGEKVLAVDGWGGWRDQGYAQQNPDLRGLLGSEEVDEPCAAQSTSRSAAKSITVAICCIPWAWSVPVNTST